MAHRIGANQSETATPGNSYLIFNFPHDKPGTGDWFACFATAIIEYRPDVECERQQVMSTKDRINGD